LSIPFFSGGSIADRAIDEYTKRQIDRSLKYSESLNNYILSRNPAINSQG
jgi:hypothetical protein